MLASKIELLYNLPIFKGLSGKQLGLIVDVATKTFFEAGDNLIAKDQPGDTAFLIMTGAAKCLHFPGAPAASDRIGPGSLVGELAMLVDTVHALTVTARTRIRALALHREAIKQAMERDPVIAQQISDNLLLRLQTFAQELRRLDDLLAKYEVTETLHNNSRGFVTEAPVAHSARSLQIPPIFKQKLCNLR